MKSLKYSLSAKVTAYVLMIIFVIAASASMLDFYYNFKTGTYKTDDFFQSKTYYYWKSSNTNELKQYLSGFAEYNRMKSKQKEDTESYNSNIDELKSDISSSSCFKYIIVKKSTNQIISSNISGGSADKIINAVTSLSESKVLKDDTEISSDIIAYCGIDKNIGSDSDLYTDYNNFSVVKKLKPYQKYFKACFIVSAIGCLAIFIFLAAAAGYKAGVDGIYLNFFDKIYSDIFLVILIAVEALIFMAVASGLDISGLNYHTIDTMSIPLLFGISSFLIIGAVSFISIIKRFKAGTFFSKTLIWQVILLLKKSFQNVSHNINTIWKVVLIFAGYLIINAVLAAILFGANAVIALIMLFLFNSAALAALCFCSVNLNIIKKGSGEIAGGNLNYRIDTKRMFYDFKKIADNLSNIGDGMQKAINEQLKSERFKSELITNVSHDIKTPLTSIINYVDLLKKEEMPNDTAYEYLDILDKKSQRLKELTESLVEASKASTGNIKINFEPVDVNELIKQSLGEFDEKFSAKNLETVFEPSEDNIIINADGRYVWRIIENVFSNINKYALDGTRVYIGLSKNDGKVTIEIKNISNQKLNITPDELMERFVRGDISRNTEGSGLGLSIARSLSELQGGTFNIFIDGDLFKSVITFNEYKQ